MASLSCPHCAAENPLGSAFCESCGKALPLPAGAPVIATGGSVPTTAIGKSLVSDELTKQMKKAFIALLIVAILQTIFGPVLLLMEKAKMEKNFPGQVIEIQTFAYVTIFGIAAVFWGLAIWARKAPLPAAIVGLGVFVTLQLIDAIADPTQIARGILMKILVIAMLVNAIQAGTKFRKLQRGEAV